MSHRHRLPPLALARVANAYRLMGPLLEFEDLLAAAGNPERFPAALTALQARVVALEADETLVLRGGWLNKSEYATEGYLGAVVCVVERDKYHPSTFTLVVCNSGSGWGTMTGEGRPTGPPALLPVPRSPLPAPCSLLPGGEGGGDGGGHPALSLQPLIALSHSLIALSHSLIALSHPLIALSHSLIALSHSPATCASEML